jgi:hypothetical protein
MGGINEKEVLNANVLDYLLDHEEIIPEEWKGKYIYFWGTVYRHNRGNRYVRCLCWIGYTWSWKDKWLGENFRSNSPAILAKDN